MLAKFPKSVHPSMVGSNHRSTASQIWCKEQQLMKSKLSESEISDKKGGEGIDLYQAYRSMIEIVAALEESEYTPGYKYQTAVQPHDDPANPASEKGTAQG
jgi:hypothetical protein